MASGGALSPCRRDHTGPEAHHSSRGRSPSTIDPLGRARIMCRSSCRGLWRPFSMSVLFTLYLRLCRRPYPAGVNVPLRPIRLGAAASLLTTVGYPPAKALDTRSALAPGLRPRRLRELLPILQLTVHAKVNAKRDGSSDASRNRTAGDALLGLLVRSWNANP